MRTSSTIYIHKYIFRSNWRGLAPLGPSAPPDKFINLTSRGINGYLPANRPGWSKNTHRYFMLQILCTCNPIATFLSLFFNIVDSISARACYNAKEHTASFCPAMSCFAVYHDAPLPHKLPSEAQQGNVFHSTVNSLYCGHPRDRELVSLIARVRSSRNLFQSNVCNLFLPGI